MGIGSRLVTSFFIVIAIMVGGYSVYAIFVDFRTTRTQADQRIALSKQKVNRDFLACEAACTGFADSLLTNNSLMQAYLKKDRSSTDSQLQKAMNEGRFPGFVSLIEPDGKVFFNTETPKQSGYSASAKSEAIRYALSNGGRSYHGPSEFTSTGVVALSSIAPIKDNSGNLKGLIVVSQPLSSMYLTGEVTRFSLEEPEAVKDVDLALFSESIGKITAASDGLGHGRGGEFVKEVNEKGAKAFPNSVFGLGVRQLEALIVPIGADRLDYTFEKSGRWWYQFKIEGLKDNQQNRILYGRLLITTPVPDVKNQLLVALIGSTLFGGLALFLGLFFSARIKGSVEEPLHFLIDRTNDIADKKARIPPLEGLSGDWLELGELIDTAVSTMRSTTQNLKLKVSKQKEELDVRTQQAEEAVGKLENLNRQIATQSRQLTEVSKQINQANRQAIIVQHKLDAVLQSSTEGFLILDQYGNILTANPIFLNWAGSTEGQIAGRQCFDLVKRPGENKTQSVAGQAFARHGGDPNAVINRFHPEGIIFHAREDKKVEVLAHLQPIVGEDSNIQGYVMVLRDKSLRSENAQLKEEIVNVLQDAIRKPIAEGESRWASVLANASQSLNPQVTQSLSELRTIYQTLLGVVDSYLMMYGGFIPEPVIPKESIVITRLVSECLEEVTPHARERQLLLDYKTVPGLPSINGNRDSVRSVLIEVLNHLISITAAGGRVRVESAIRGPEMRMSVTSSGPALPLEEITDMFVGFVQGKHTEDTYARRLSLYLARNNVERLGGQIWAESEAGRGTAIYFTLPSQT
ncbi:MAG: PAS domain-containing protein [Cyanobacteria bacterium HKST-UBA02]|nr:PAS domain-containing protein [Cyanobacteria bacterium HKST-UBA02]